MHGFTRLDFRPDYQQERQNTQTEEAAAVVQSLCHEGGAQMGPVVGAAAWEFKYWRGRKVDKGAWELELSRGGRARPSARSHEEPEMNTVLTLRWRHLQSGGEVTELLTSTTVLTSQAPRVQDGCLVVEIKFLTQRVSRKSF